MRFSGNVALITGGDRGIGRATALALAKEGASIVVVYRSNEKAARETCERIEKVGAKCVTFKVNVASSEEVREMVEKSVERFGKIDLLINAAAVVTLKNVVDLSEAEWDLVMNVNAKGTFFCSKYVALEMIKRNIQGKIVNISSRAGKIGLKGNAHYSASKFAVLGFTQSLALELLPYGIHVNAVCPGRTDTDMMRGEIIEEAGLRMVPIDQVKKELTDSVPFGRFATPEEVANVVVFLCSEDSNYIVGQTINVTGGLDLIRGGH